MPATRSSRRLQKLSPEKDNKVDEELLSLKEKLTLRTPSKPRKVVKVDNDDKENIPSPSLSSNSSSPTSKRKLDNDEHNSNKVKKSQDLNVYANARNKIRTINSITDEDSLIGREIEINFIKEFLIDDTNNSTLYVSGPPGGGKTASVKIVCQTFKSKVLWVNCMAVPNVDDVKSNMLQYKNRNILLIVLDEIDNLRFDNLIEIFKIAQKNTYLKLIGIANSLDLTSNQLQNLTKPPLHLQINPYNHQQLFRIIDNRLGDYKHLFIPQALEILCRKVGALSGDLRSVVSILSYCLDNVEKDAKKKTLALDEIPNAPKVTMPIMLKSINARFNKQNALKSNNDKNSNKISSLNFHSKLVLISIILTFRRRSSTKCFINIYDNYVRLLNTHSTISPQPKSDFNDLISILTSSSVLIEYQQQQNVFENSPMLGTPSKRARAKAISKSLEPEFVLQYSENEIIKILNLNNNINEDDDPLTEQLKRIWLNELSRIESDQRKSNYKSKKSALMENNQPPVDVF